MRICMVLLLSALAFPGCAKKKSAGFTVPEDYRTWKKPVNKILDYEISGHGKSYRIIYANDIAYNAEFIKDEEGTRRLMVPDGAIIIKETFMSKKDIKGGEPIYTVMVKNSRSEKAAHGWLYYMKEPGEPMVLVQSRMCTGCHVAANDRHPYFDKNPEGIFRDYLFIDLGG